MLYLYHVVLVVCTIATAKVPLGFAASLVEERNYNCYNVYFNECLQETLVKKYQRKYKLLTEMAYYP